MFLNPTSIASLPKLVLSLGLAALLGLVLGEAYFRFGLSNRRSFARNFLMLTVTTTLIISIVRSSLALSLGLVGALSIVRFRAAIKEPEEQFGFPNLGAAVFPAPRRAPSVVLELKYEVQHETVAESVTNSLPFRLARCSKFILGLEGV